MQPALASTLSLTVRTGQSAVPAYSVWSMPALRRAPERMAGSGLVLSSDYKHS